MRMYEIAVCLLALMSMSAALNIALSDQGTSVKNTSSGSLLATGNLTVLIYDSLAGGNLLYIETFANAISNGSWNEMLGVRAVPLSLNYSTPYYKTYEIDGEAATFTASNGSTVSRQLFYSPLGPVNWTLLQNFPNPCAAGTLMSGVGTTLLCSSFNNLSASDIMTMVGVNLSLLSFNITSVNASLQTQIQRGNEFNTTKVAYTDLATAINNGTIARTGTATCAGSTVVQNITTTTSGVTTQCVATGGSGTVTQIDTGTGISGGPITSTGTLTINQADIVSLIGNWSSDKIAVYANQSLQSQNATSINNSLTNTSRFAFQTNASMMANDSALSVNITAVNTSLTNTSLFCYQTNQSLLGNISQASVNNTLLNGTINGLLKSAGGWSNTTTVTSTALNASMNLGLILNTTTARPTCAAGERGRLWFNQSAGGITDYMFACMKNSTNAYNWILIARGD